jgi:multicomponent Na+:H+ antiporter subunit D
VTLLVAPLFLTWVAAVAAAVLDGRRRAVGGAAVAVLAAAFGLALALTLRIAAAGPVDAVMGGWPADVGIRLRADALGAAFATVSLAVLVAALAREVAAGVGSRGLPALMLVMATGLTGLFLTGDVFSFYVFFELAIVSAYVMSAYGDEARQLGGAFVFAVVNLIGTFLFLLAIAALYRVTGTLEMEAAARSLARTEEVTAVLIAVTFFVAFAVKLGLFPFHFWLPTVYTGCVPVVAAVLAGAIANIGAYGLVRFGAGVLPRELERSSLALLILGIGSILYGSLQAVSRRDGREVLAYSSISQAGYVLVALGVGGAVGLAAAVVFALANALGKALLFLAVDVRGWLAGAAFAVGAFSVAGVPPSAGFLGKAALFSAALEDGPVLVGLLVLGTALSFAYMFQIYQHDFWRGESPAPRRPGVTRAVGPLLAALVVALGLWPEPLLAAGRTAADVLAPAPR